MWREWSSRQVRLIDSVDSTLLPYRPMPMFPFELPLSPSAFKNSFADCACLSQRTKKAPLNPLATLDPGIVNPGAVEPAALK